jgi:hypothetical protein
MADNDKDAEANPEEEHDEEVIEDEEEEVIYDDDDEEAEAEVEEKLVEDDEEAPSSPSPASKTVLPEEEGPSAGQKRIMMLTCFLCLGVVIAGVIVPLLLDLSDSPSIQSTVVTPTTPTAPGAPVSPPTPDDTNSTEPTTLPPSTNPPTSINFNQFLTVFLLPKFGEEPFEDPGNILYMAAEHMANNDAYSFDGGVRDELELADRFGAFVLYFALNGDSWNSCGIASADCDGNRWGEGDHCEWEGISPCNKDGRISSIEFTTGFTGGGLSGTIPQELYVIDQLEEFIIEDSGSITGTLPEQFGMMANMMKVFDVTGKDLEGPIPDDFLTFSPLESLFLGGNQLTGKFPTKLPLTLQQLSLPGNSITGFFPDELFGMKDLKLLDLTGLGMSGPLPLNFKNLESIEELYLDDNAFSGTVPESFGDLEDLSESHQYIIHISLNNKVSTNLSNILSQLL